MHRNVIKLYNKGHKKWKTWNSSLLEERSVCKEWPVFLWLYSNHVAGMHIDIILIFCSLNYGLSVIIIYLL